MNWVFGVLVEAKNRYYGAPDYHPVRQFVLSNDVLEGVIRAADVLYFDDCFDETYRTYPVWEEEEIYANGRVFADKNCERMYRARMYCLLRYISACHGGISHRESLVILRPHINSLELQGLLK